MADGAAKDITNVTSHSARDTPFNADSLIAPILAEKNVKQTHVVRVRSDPSNADASVGRWATVLNLRAGASTRRRSIFQTVRDPTQFRRCRPVTTNAAPVA